MDYLEFAQDVVAAAIRAGAHEAEVVIQPSDSFSVVVRKGEVEVLNQSSSKGLGLRVFVDKRMSFASATDFSGDVIADIVKSTVQLAKSASRDRYNGLPEMGMTSLPTLDLFDPEIAEFPVERKIQMAKDAEKAAYDYDKRITNSYGASYGTFSGQFIIANSNGILYSSAGTGCGIGCSPLAEQDGEMQTGSYYSAKRFINDLEEPEKIGKEAAFSAVRKLGARKVETQKAPIVFDWRVSPVLIGTVFGALNGEDVHRGMSFLKKKLDKPVASPMVTLIDDPLLPRGMGSGAFDGEGIPTRKKVVVENGILKQYFYDSYAARKYKTQPTGNAGRSYSGLPSVSPMNFYLQQTDKDTSDIIREIENGFYVLDTMGHQGISSITGDFSVGASGIWIKDGELAFPVQEVTIAGNMLDMMKNIIEIGNDAKFQSSVVSPTIKIAEMTISGT